MTIPLVHPEPDPASAMRDVPLGTLIYRSGLLKAEQLEAALAEGNQTGKRLGEVLVGRGLLEEAQLARLLAGQKGLPYVELEPPDVDPDAVRLLPAVAAKQLGAVAIRFEEGVPVIVVSDPGDERVLQYLRDRVEGEYRLAVAARSSIERVAVAAAGVDSGAAAVAAPSVAAAASASASAPVPAPPPPPAPAPAPAPAPEFAPAPEAASEPPEEPLAAPYAVELRLVNGERLELVRVDDRAAADAAASDLVQQLIAGEASGWIALGGRYIRPGAIVSLDVVEP